MNAAELLRHLTERGVTLRAEGGLLKCSAPKGVLTAELRDNLTAVKPALIALLAHEGGTLPTSIARRTDRSQSLPSFAQERVHDFARHLPDASRSTLMLTYRVAGPLDLAALERSLQQIVARHDVLRTTFEESNGTLVAKVSDVGSVALEVEDLRHLPPEAQSSRSQFASVPTFDLGRGPLLRARVAILADDASLLVLACHQIVFDTGGIAVFASELAAHYAAYERGGESPLPELSLQYGDYAAWQREVVAADLPRLEEFWRAQFTRLPRSPVLPGRQADAPRVVDDEIATVTSRVAGEAALRRLAQNGRATPFMVHAALLAALVGVRSDVDEVCLFTSVAGRSDPALAPLIGLFANWVMLRIDLRGDPTIGELVRRVRDIALGAFQHQDLPFDRALALRESEAATTSGSPFAILFTFHDHAVAGSIRAGGATFSPVEVPQKGTPFEWQVSIEDRGALGAALTIGYPRRLFDESGVESAAADYARLVAMSSDNPPLSVLRAHLGGSPVARASTERKVAPPRTETERALLTIWERVLGTKGIGVDDNFFALGGYSLLAVRLFDELEAAYGLKLTLHEFMRAASIARLAKLVDRGEASEAK